MIEMMVNQDGDNTLDFLDVIDQRIKTILRLTQRSSRRFTAVAARAP